MRRLLDPRSIAIIGASADRKRLGGVALDHLVDFGYGGAVYPINPKYQEIHGLRCYPDIDSLPQTPDVAVLAVGVDLVLPPCIAAMRTGCGRRSSMRPATPKRANKGREAARA